MKKIEKKEEFFDKLGKYFTWKPVTAPLKLLDGECILFLVKKKPRFWLLEQLDETKELNP